MKKIISLLVVLAMLMAMAPAVFATSPNGTIEIESYGNADWTAPESGYVQFTINISGGILAILNGYTPLAEGTDSVTVQVTAGTTYGVYPGYNVAEASVITWEYVDAPSGGNAAETIPNGGELALGDNNVTLTYATMPMMAVSQSLSDSLSRYKNSVRIPIKNQCILAFSPKSAS